jgi:LemA protein
MSIGLIILLVLGGLFLAAVGIYNRLVSLKNQVQNAWRQIDVQLQRRYDLIPNLIETVKGYMQYEKGTLEAVIKARSEAISARDSVKEQGGPAEGSLLKLMGAEGKLNGALANVFALTENYPELKASENMRLLQEELSSTENKVAFARQAYNDQVMGYNTAQQQFPAVLIANALGFHAADLFEVQDEAAKSAVKVSF